MNLFSVQPPFEIDADMTDVDDALPSLAASSHGVSMSLLKRSDMSIQAPSFPDFSLPDSQPESAQETPNESRLSGLSTIKVWDGDDGDRSQGQSAEQMTIDASSSEMTGPLKELPVGTEQAPTQLFQQTINLSAFPEVSQLTSQAPPSNGVLLAATTGLYEQQDSQPTSDQHDWSSDKETLHLNHLQQSAADTKAQSPAPVTKAQSPAPVTKTQSPAHAVRIYCFFPTPLTG